MMARLSQFHIELALLLYLSSTTAAQNNTQPSRSEDNGLIGWQSNPNRRGTMNILESCMLTIIACTWTIHHQNIPEQKPKNSMRTLLDHLKWMTLTILVPEFILAQAVDEFLWVHKTWKDLHKPVTEPSERKGVPDAEQGDTVQGDIEQGKVPNIPPNTKHKWSKKHLYYANMGGFRVNFSGPIINEDDPTYNIPLTSGELIRYPISQPSTGRSSASQLSISQSFMSQPSTNQQSTSQPSTGQPLSAVGPPISKTDIERMVKRDALAKTISFLQISWIILSTLARWHLHRPTSQLEIMTVAFAACAVLTYIIRWHKPQHVEICTNIPYAPVDLRQLYEPQRFFHIVTDLWRKKRIHRRHIDSWRRVGARNARRSYFRNDTLRPLRVDKSFLPSLIFFMVIIGGLHLVAWNFSFPSSVERDMWRTASLASASIPLLLFIFSSCIPWLLVSVKDLFTYMRHKEQQGGEAENFRQHCKELLENMLKDQDFWDLAEGHLNADAEANVDTSKRILDESDGAPKNYRDIFVDSTPQAMLLYVEVRLHRLINLTSDPTFPSNLRRLFEISDRTRHASVFIQEVPTTYDDDFDRTNVFPRETAKWRRGHMSYKILSFTMPLVSALYTVSRLMIIAIAFSSLRAMPTGVYETTWTGYLPKFD